MESSETLPLPTSPQQTIETLATKPHCQMCALYALTRAQLKRIACRNCATKAHIDSPVLMLFLFREFVTMRNALRGLQNREKDLTKIVLEEFETGLRRLLREIQTHEADRAMHPDPPDRLELQGLESRIDQVANDLIAHVQDPGTHPHLATLAQLSTVAERIENTDQDLRTHSTTLGLHFLEDDRQALSDTIDRVEAIQKELDSLRNAAS